MFKKLSKMEVIQSITPYDCYFSPVSEIEELKKKLKTGNLEIKAVAIDLPEADASRQQRKISFESDEKKDELPQNNNLNNNNVNCE